MEIFGVEFRSSLAQETVAREVPQRHDDCAGVGGKIAVVVEGGCFVCRRFSSSRRLVLVLAAAKRKGKERRAAGKGHGVPRRKTGRGRRRSHRLGSRSRLHRLPVM